MRQTYFFNRYFRNHPIESLPLTTNDGRAIIWIDVRPYQAFLSGHLPGARWIDLSPWMVALDTSEDLKNLSTELQKVYKLLGLHGAGSDAVLVLYDQGLSPLLCRSAFILGLGGMDVMLWPDGWQSFVTDQPIQMYEPTLSPVIQLRREWLLLGEEAAIHPNLIDVRTKKEYHGQMVAPCCAQGGRIEGATHIELARFMEDTSRLLQTEPALRKVPLGLYCHSGARSAVVFFLLREQGLPVKNYFDSIHGWLRAGRPVVKDGLHEHRPYL